jgi:hypothetical protein
MKKLMTVLVLIGSTSTAWAHGGGLNRQGCHNDHSNGSYHCHPAQPSGNNNDVEKVLGALFLFGLLAAATNNQCETEWYVVGENHTHLQIAEVDSCTGNILQQSVVKK